MFSTKRFQWGTIVARYKNLISGSALAHKHVNVAYSCLSIAKSYRDSFGEWKQQTNCTGKLLNHDECQPDCCSLTIITDWQWPTFKIRNIKIVQKFSIKNNWEENRSNRETLLFDKIGTVHFKERFFTIINSYYRSLFKKNCDRRRRRGVYRFRQLKAVTYLLHAWRRPMYRNMLGGGGRRLAGNASPPHQRGCIIIK